MVLSEVMTEVFSVDQAKFYQSDSDEQFCIVLNDDSFRFKLCDLIKFKNKLNSIDLSALLLSAHCDVELIYLPHIDRFLLLNIREILVLKELLSGAFAMMELNSIIQRAFRFSYC